jgi:hypothetical protein
MQSSDQINAREVEITKIAESKQDIAVLRKHLKDIIEGPSFKGSHRSGQFLTYVVEQAMAGHFDQLKERLIGVELFGRSPSYDTGEDAIVRVTASDVRKRLHSHYGRDATSSEFRLNLPSGSYIPEITRNGHGEPGLRNPINVSHESPTILPDQVAAFKDSVSTAPGPVDDSHTVAQPGPSERPHQYRWLLSGSLLVAIAFALWNVVASRSRHIDAAQIPIDPWSVLFNSSHSTHLITSDPNIVVVQEITGGQLSVSDYANHKYIPEPNKLKPEEIRFCHTLLWGDNSAAAVDTPIAARVGALAQANSKMVDVRAARSIQISDLKTDDNFIFLGSPRSDPWFSLFNDELDFRFVFDKATGQEVISNVRAQPQELKTYVPTAQGWATGQSFAIIAFVQNLDQNGHVLLLAGANGEGTQAAGKLVTDLPRFSTMLSRCGIVSAGQLQHFEMLLHLNTMAATPSNVDMVACHILSGSSAQKQ